MKKLIFILILFIPLTVNATEVSITDFLVDSTILENGDMEVKELIVADGTFNWYERDLLYKNSALTSSDNYDNNSIYNASDIEVLELKAKNISNVSFNTFNENFDILSYNMHASNGDKGYYGRTQLTDGYRYRMYYYTNHDKTAFYLRYIVHDVVVAHKDVAEVYWTFVPDGFEEDLHNIKIRVNLPKEDNTDNYRVWAHGHISGEVKKENNKSIFASINSVFKGDTVDIRLIFDKSLITNASKTRDDYAKDSIIEVETKRAEEANNLREMYAKKEKFCIVSSSLMIIVILILFAYTYYKYGKSPKSDYYSKYNREFIDDYNVEVVDYLMNRSITPNAMSASILNLIYKKNITVEEIPTSKRKEYKFTLKNTDNINESERLLIAFLFDKVGNKETKEFTTIELKNYAKSVKTCDTFLTNYKDWENEVKKTALNENFYVKSHKPVIIGVITLLISYFIFTYGIATYPNGAILYTLLLILTVLYFIYSIVVIKKTQKGIDHYTKWQAFKNFLKDFGTFELKELPEIALWERYLVYATVFGLADKVKQSMNVKIKEIDMYNDYYPSFIYLDFGPSINSSITSSINTARATSSNYHTTSSSGSGFGGGFSSGGGFGGGGGGGRFG